MALVFKYDLNETIDTSGLILIFKTKLNEILPHGDNSLRGNGVSTQILCSIINKKHNKTLNPDDYILHHIDGNHSNNDVDNLMLIKSNALHKKFHSDTLKSAISAYCNLNNLYLLDADDNKTRGKIKGKYKVDEKKFKESLRIEDVAKILSLYNDINNKRTTRAEMSHDDSFILVSKYI